VSPPQGLASPSAPGRPVPGGGAQALPTPWTEAGYEIQVLLARARGVLLRRPRALGNWVQAFALHDPSGQGVLGCAEFAAFLDSLSLGFSRREVFMVAECLLRENGTVSLGSFSEAITHASPDAHHNEAWAAATARALAGGAPGGLAALADRSPEAVAQLQAPLSAVDAERFSAWLPKTPDGNVDWARADDWCFCDVSGQRR